MKQRNTILAITIGLLSLSLNANAFLFSKTKDSALNQERKSFDSMNQNIESTVQGQKTPPTTVTVGGWGNKLALSITNAIPAGYSEHNQANVSANANVNTAQSEVMDYRTVLPLPIWLLLMALGIVAICWAIKYASNQSAALKVALTTGDNLVARMEEKITHHLIHDNTSDKKTVLHDIQATLHKHKQ